LNKAARELTETAAERAGKSSDNITVALARPAAAGSAVGAARLPWLAFVGVAVAALIAAVVLVFSFDPGDTPVSAVDTQQQDTATAGEDEEDAAGRTARERDEERSRSAIERPETESRQSEEAERQERRRTERRQSLPLERDPQGGSLRRDGGPAQGQQEQQQEDPGTGPERDPADDRGAGDQGGTEGDSDLDIENLDRSENRPRDGRGLGPERRGDPLGKDADGRLR
jgi:hypothetical protein